MTDNTEIRPEIAFHFAVGAIFGAAWFPADAPIWALTLFGVLMFFASWGGRVVYDRLRRDRDEFTSRGVSHR